jgi:hypothetical protein
MRVFSAARFFCTCVCAALLLAWGGPAAAQTMNACGCYQEPDGSCKCIRKASKCGCPGECEPAGCEAKRAKQADKEAAAELRRIAAREKKLAADAAKAAREKQKAEKAAALKTAKEGKNGKADKAEKARKESLEKAVLQLQQDK